MTILRLELVIFERESKWSGIKINVSFKEVDSSIKLSYYLMRRGFFFFFCLLVSKMEDRTLIETRRITSNAKFHHKEIHRDFNR